MAKTNEYNHIPDLNSGEGVGSKFSWWFDSGNFSSKRLEILAAELKGRLKILEKIKNDREREGEGRSRGNSKSKGEREGGRKKGEREREYELMANEYTMELKARPLLKRRETVRRN
jgi:hypothetical protein